MSQMNLVRKLLNRITEEKKSIVVIGDAMTDVWIHGQVHTGCQDNCTKFVEESYYTTYGGAANAHNCLRNWVIPTTLYTDIKRCLKTRYLVDNKIMFRADDDTISHLPTLERIIALAAVSKAGAVLLSDYNKGVLKPEFIKDIVGVCNEHHIPCIADCKRAPEVYNGCVLKGNIDWFLRYGPDKCDVATRGETRPMVKNIHYLRSDAGLPPVECINHVGAGDCFAAHLTLSLAYGFSLRDAAMLAHSAGRVYVQHLHSRPPYPDEIALDLDSVIL